MSQEAMKPIVPAAPETAQQEQKKESSAQQSDPRMEQLAKRERAFRAQQRQFQQEQAEFKQQQEKLKSTPDLSWKENLKKDPIAVLAEAGFTHEQIAQQLINRSPESLEMKQLRAEIADLRKEQKDTFEKVNSTQSKAYEQALKQVARDVKITVHGNEEFELINSKGTVGHDAVVEYIKSTYEEDGILLSADEAAKEVEEYLLEEATALAKLKKVQAKLTPPEVLKNPEQKTQTQQKTQTLTNQATTSTPSGKLDSKERKQRAILAFQGLLNK